MHTLQQLSSEMVMSGGFNERRDNLRDAGGRFSKSTRKEIKAFLRGGYSHAKFERVMHEFPIDLRGFVPDGLPYSAWQVLEHMRIAQRHMLDYATQRLTNAPGSAPKTLLWPRDCWVRQQVPAKDDSWERSVRGLGRDGVWLTLAGSAPMASR